MARSIRDKNDGRGKTSAPNGPAPNTPDLDGDRLNFYLLIVLYILQGFPIGMCVALQTIFQSRGTITFNDQAKFSLVQWPYSLKLLWAPVVDALYIQCIGRRKCWILPLQSLMGLLFIYMGNNINSWLPESGQPNLWMIICTTFSINFLSATQDIVVDGWALTLFKKKNVSYASTCNSVGVPIGMFVGSVCFTLLDSERFCNKFLRFAPATGGLITMKSFLYFFGIVTLTTTLLVGIFKKEKENQLENGYIKINVFQNYKLLWNIFKLPHIRVLAIALLTTKVGFAATDFVSNLKLIDVGVSKDDIMVITSAMYAVKFFLPIFVSKYVTGPNPMSYFLKMTPIRLLWGLTYVVLIHYTPSLLPKNGAGEVPKYYYFLLGLVCTVNEVMSFFMMLTLFAFFCRISDPRYGGTYMTLFNTFYYLGFSLSNTLVLKLVATFTFGTKFDETNRKVRPIALEGYYVTVAVCLVIGFIWYYVFRNKIKKYQSMSQSLWLVDVKQSAFAEGVKEPCISLTVHV